MSVCRSCGARIFWAKTLKGKRMPLDGVPNPAGNVVIIDHRRTLVSVLGKDDAAVARSRGDRLWMPHFVSCPSAQEHRP